MPAPNPSGRPTLFELEPELLDEMELHLRNGNYIETVCDFVGVWSMDFRRWMRRGREELRRVRNARQELEEQEAKIRKWDCRADTRRKVEAKLPQLRTDCEVRESERKYVDLFVRMKRAMAQSVASAIAIINRAAVGAPATEEVTVMPDGTQVTRRTSEVRPQWQAAAWRLERTQGRNFARPQPQTISVIGGGKNDPPVQVDNTFSGAEVVFYMPHNGRPSRSENEVPAVESRPRRPVIAANPEPENDNDEAQ